MVPPGPGGPGGGQQQMLVMNPNMKKESGWKAQESNITAAKAVASIIRSTLGPKAMLKMILDPMGGIVMTNDGNAILREVDVVHPTANVNGYMEALQLVQGILDEIAIPIDTSKKDVMLDLIQASVGTKFVSRWGTMISELALAAARTVMIEQPSGKIEVDLKRYARVEKIPGGELEECEVLQGVMFNKDVTHHKMRKDIKNPRVILIDCPLEYKKNESNTNVEITNEQDWEAMLMQEEEEVQKLCDDLIKHKPDLVITEKGVSDLAQHFLLKAGIAVIHRIRKTDNNRVAKACGATIANRTDELTEEDVGTP